MSDRKEGIPLGTHLSLVLTVKTIRFIVNSQTDNKTLKNNNKMSKKQLNYGLSCKYSNSIRKKRNKLKNDIKGI